MATPYKYFVGGLPRNCTNDQLALGLSPYGELLEATVCTRGGVTRGFGFVTFSGPPDASVLQGGVMVNGTTVSVKEAVPETQPGDVDVESKNKYFVGGIPLHCTNVELHAAFQLYGAVKEANVLTKADGSSRGFGFVTFHSAPSPAMFQSPVDVLGRTVTIKESVPQSDMQNRKMFVGGLTVDMTEEHLGAIFGVYGPVTETQVIRDPNTGLSRGFGFVIFENDTARHLALMAFPGEYDGVPLSVRPVEGKGNKSQAQGKVLPAMGRLLPKRTKLAPGVPLTTESALRQKLADEQRRRIALEQRLAQIEQGGAYGYGYDAWTAPAPARAGSGRRYRPY